MKKNFLYMAFIVAWALCACSSSNDDDEQDIQAVYYGTFLETVSGNQSSSDEIYPTGVDVIPYEVENLKDTLKFEGLTATTTQYSFTLTVKERSSYLDVIEDIDGDSLFCWYAKEKVVYKGGKYTSDDGVYEFEVTADGIYLNHVGAGDEYKRLYKSLDDYAEIRYTKTGKSEKRAANDVSLRLSCADNSMHYIGDNREYRATIDGNICALYEFSPQKDNFELDRIK